MKRYLVEIELPGRKHPVRVACKCTREGEAYEMAARKLYWFYHETVTREQMNIINVEDYYG